MKNKASIWCYICAVVSYIAGVLYSLSLIFLPIAIYCFIFGNRYLRIAKIKNHELPVIRSLLVSSALFISVIAFPIGLVSIIPVCLSGKVQQKNNDVKYDNASSTAEAETVKAETVEVTSQKKNSSTTLSAEDLEKIEKLSKFRQQGLLTDEEFEEAKKQIMNQK